MSLYVTIARQRGLFARTAGKKLAEILGCAFYDNSIMSEYSNDEIKEYFKNSGELKKSEKYYGNFDFALRTYPTVNELIHAEQERIVTMLADKGSAVFVGRSTGGALEARKEDKVFKVFLYASEEYRVRQIVEEHGLSEKEALKHIRDIDKSRASYFEHYNNKKWGDKDTYDLLINCEGLSTDQIAAMIAACVNA